MDLFSKTLYEHNLLPYDGEVYYHGSIMNADPANAYFDMLMNMVSWKNDEAIIYGKHYITDRKVAWYGNRPYPYSYSNTTRYALPWFKELLELKTIVEDKTEKSYNSCLLNLYHNGNEGMAWHSDDEISLAKGYGIASLSFGAMRKFSFKNKENKKKVDVYLENGSLLLMAGDTQTYWLHSLPKTKKVKTPRINLTFRKMDEDQFIK